MSEQKYIRIEDVEELINKAVIGGWPADLTALMWLQRREKRSIPAYTPAEILAGMWESVAANPPKVDTPCWVTDGDKGLELVIRLPWGWKCVASVHDIDGPVTHWMPLPSTEGLHEKLG